MACSSLVWEFAALESPGHVTLNSFFSLGLTVLICILCAQKHFGPERSLVLLNVQYPGVEILEFWSPLHDLKGYHGFMWTLRCKT